MFKSDLVRKVAKETRLSQHIVSDVLGASHDAIRDALKRGQEVQLPCFGTFYTRQRPEGTIQSFGTKKMVRVPAMRVAAFRVGDVLKRSVRKQPEAESFLRWSQHLPGTDKTLA
jgi:DNA-binding protein HU-beta